MMYGMRYVLLFILLVPINVIYAESYDIYVSSIQNSPGCENNDTCWSEKMIRINQYDDITWHNDSNYPISVTSGDRLDDKVGESFDSRIISPTETFSYTFEKSGEFSYFSMLQPWMVGSIVVDASDKVMDDELMMDDGTVMDDELVMDDGTVMDDELMMDDDKVMDDERMMDDDDKVMDDRDTAMDDDKVMDDGGGCLIATATYGTEMAYQVQLLREIRDNKLMSTDSGMAFMSGFNTLYYSFSPIIADMERESPIFKETIKLFITPMLSTMSIMNVAESNDELSTVLLGLSVLFINGMMYVGIPVGIVFVIRKHKIF